MDVLVPTTPQLLTTGEAATLLQVSSRTILNWIGAETIPYVKLPSNGGRSEYRIPLQGLLSSLSGNYDLAGECAISMPRRRQTVKPTRRQSSQTLLSTASFSAETTSRTELSIQCSRRAPRRTRSAFSRRGLPRAQGTLSQAARLACLRSPRLQRGAGERRRDGQADRGGQRRPWSCGDRRAGRDACAGNGELRALLAERLPVMTPTEYGLATSPQLLEQVQALIQQAQEDRPSLAARCSNVDLPSAFPSHGKDDRPP